MKHVLVTTDFSPLGDEALVPAADLARQLGGKLTLTHVLTSDPPPEPDPKGSYYKFAKSLWEADQELAKRALEGLQERALAVGNGIEVECVISRGGAVDAVLDSARSGDVDLIVMSSQGRSGLSRILLGSVAEELIRRSPIPVLIWKGGRAEPKPGEEAGEQG